MKSEPEVLIEILNDEERPILAIERQLLIRIMEKWRDCLIKISQCQGGMASLQAQDLLTEAGYCSHARAIYKAKLSGSANAYSCPDCGGASPDRMVPYR